ncbi:MAG: putative membrane protein [Candidatus Nanohaloarchaea archaeon]|jgi:putative membrane protein
MKLSKLSIPYRALKKVFTILVFLVFTSLQSLTTAEPIIIVGFLLLVSLSVFLLMAYEYLYWRNFEYSIEEDGLKILSGVITKNDRDIPLKRIQNVDVNRNILQRVIGIAEVNVETAGGSKTEAALKYMTYEKAKEMQKQVRELKNRRKTTEPEKEGEKREDFALSNKDLGILSLASIDQRIAGGLIAVVSIVAGSAGLQIDGGSTVQLAIGMIIAAFVLVAFWAASTFSTFAKFFDFKLYFHDNALEYERGLFNRASGTIPEEKIQDVIIEENFIQRYFNYASLQVETAGYAASGDQREIDTGKETVIPLAKRPEIEKFAREIGGYTEPQLQSINQKAEQRYFHRYLLVGGALAVAGFIATQFTQLSWQVYIPAAIVLVSSRKAANLKWKNIGYHLAEDHFFTRKGFWKRQTYVVPYFRVQNLMQNQTILQKRWNQSTLLLDTAGSVISYPHVPDMDTQEAEELRSEIYKRFIQSLQK